MAELLALLHVSLLVSDLARARFFYEGVLGLQPNSSRPSMSFDGVWYDVGIGQIHLICLPSPDPSVGRPQHAGRDRHVAFAVRDLTVLKSRLDELGMEYTTSQSGRVALFVRDPDGNALELVPQTIQ